jgi:hypothetical protein
MVGSPGSNGGDGSSLHSSIATQVQAPTLYASPPTPTVPIVSTSSPWLTKTKPSPTFQPVAVESDYPSLRFHTAKIFHAVLGIFAFLFVFPLGGIIIKVWPHRHIVWIHAAIQVSGLLLYVACTVLGIYMGRQLYTLKRYHAVLGLIVLFLLFLQPLTKLHWLHSSVPRVGLFVHVHLWLGRIVLTLGIIDGALGFRISETLKGPHWDPAFKIAYGVVAGIVWVVYVGICVVWVELKKVPRAAPPSPGAPPREILALAAQDTAGRGAPPKLGITVVSASAVNSQVESVNRTPVTPRRRSKIIWV